MTNHNYDRSYFPEEGSCLQTVLAGIVLIAIAVLLVGCAPIPVKASQPQSTMRPVASQSLSDGSNMANPTLDLQSTADAAQMAAFLAERESQYAVSTAQAANVAVAQITQQAEAMELERARITQQAYESAASATQYSIGATATAEYTTIPMTQTQQAAINTQVPRQQALISAQMTQTYQAPTQLVAMTRAEDARKYSWVEMFVRLFTLFSLGIFLLSIAAFAWRAGKYQYMRDQLETEVAEIPQPTVERTYPAETVLVVRQDYGSGFGRTERMVVPCSVDQFTALVSGVLNQGRTLAYNVWEGADEPFTRDEFTAVRNWLLSNRLAQSVGQGKIILSAAGESLFIEWLNNQVLPTGYDFIGEQHDKSQ